MAADSSAISWTTIWRVLIGIAVTVILLLGVFHLRLVLAWSITAALIALAAHPAVRFLERHGVKRGWAVLLVYLIGIGALAALVGTVVPMLIEQARSLLENAPGMVKQLERTAAFRWANRELGVMDALAVGLRERTAQMFGPALEAAGAVVNAVIATVSILSLSVFVLMFGNDLLDDILDWIKPEHRVRCRELVDRMRHRVGGYIFGTVLIATSGGLVMGVTTAILGVPYFLALGLIMILFGLIPILGSFFGAILIIGVTLATEGIQDALIAGGVYLVYQQIESQVLQPLIQRRTLEMNPLIITVALLAGTGLGGVLGALIALPVAGILQVILQEVLASRQARWTADGVPIGSANGSRTDQRPS